MTASTGSAKKLKPVLAGDAIPKGPNRRQRRNQWRGSNLPWWHQTFQTINDPVRWVMQEQK